MPGEKLQAEIKQRKLAIERIAAKGWQDTPLRGTVDMIVLGSVAQDGDGYLVEAKFHTAGGKIIFSEIGRARSAARHRRRGARYRQQRDRALRPLGAR